MEEGTDRQPVACVIYAAKSTTDVRGSIPTQLEDSRAAIDREGGTVAAEFSDENRSAWSGNRGDGLAQAKETAARLAAEHGRAELWVQHSDRIARGDGLKADHLAEIYFAMRKAGVRLRSVQDDGNLEDAIRAVLIGERNSEDSERKAQAVRDGMRRLRDRAGASWLAQGIKPDGYLILREYENGRMTHRAIKDPERGQIYELIFALAAAGHSSQAIERECAGRGYVTNPVRRGYKPGPFDTHRINQALTNPIYAGYVKHKGEIIGEGDWPRFIEPEDWHRLQAERKARDSQTRRKRGRPVVGYLLSQLAVCGACDGSIQAQTYGRRKKDGTQTRTYLCAAHKEHHRESENRCTAMPFDANVVDQLVLESIARVLDDAGALRDQLEAGRASEIARLARIAEGARRDAKHADQIVEKAMARYERALAEDDDEAAEIALSAVRRKREEARQARARLDATLDAVSGYETPDDADVLARVWHALSERVSAARGDVKALNLALREWFDAMELHHDGDRVRVVPVLSAVAVGRIMSEQPWTVGSEHTMMVSVPRDQADEFEQAIRSGRLLLDVAFESVAA